MKNINEKKIAIIGATGMVGRELIGILEERWPKIKSLELYSSKTSMGEKISFLDQSLVVKELKDDSSIDADVAFFATDGKIAKKFIPKLASKGILCIDKSGAFREEKDIVLMVPEINSHEINEAKVKNIIASPNCVVTPLVQVLFLVHNLFGLEQVVVSTYQAVSGAGKSATDELELQVRNLFNLRELENKVFNERIAFNVLPFIPSFSPVDDFLKTEEEQKIINETKKILNLKNLMMEVTSVRVPVFNGHSMAVNIGTKNQVNFSKLIDTLNFSGFIMLVDDPKKGLYPTPLKASGDDKTLVGRIRPNTSVKNGLSLWISADNLRVGAALNAVRIFETIMLGA